ncbi:hypothetical protein [Pseudothauera rhizosphaerae]|uniref:Uncharacterized protein n=1 Tax=Pseudothauera rhizosphaerae TaxID=2565932 RepID=A0A4S4AAI0_9RHOO|nr:hypothetical protein [Pseudothauera rhizosphaerae]THF55906.1 hypothetical protein E6O51_20180 [Pseudothauera rhizosphaerae]
MSYPPYPKLWHNSSAVGEALVRALQRTGVPWLSAHTADGVEANVMDRLAEVKSGRQDAPIYMESGTLSWTFPGPLNPDRAYPATWHFGDIPYNNPPADPHTMDAAPWLGEVCGIRMNGGLTRRHPKMGAETGAQRARRPLTEGMDSLAIGYPRSDDPVVDADRRDAAEVMTVMKKLCAGYFPASLWTGLMRRFIQAQWGARQARSTWPWIVDIVGTQPVLLYSQPGVETQWQAGYWSHRSPGIFRSPDHRYWLLDIRQPSGTAFMVDAYPVVGQGAVGRALHRAYRTITVAAVVSEDTRRKIESYMFAHSRIDLAAKVTIGTYDPERIGGALAYGWKFNPDGSEAKVVLVAKDGWPSDKHIKSSVVTLQFGYSPVAEESPSPAWLSVSGSATGYTEWMDGWGSHNILVPEDETGGALTLYSVRAEQSGLRSIPNFSDAPLYGYYVDDEFELVTISRSDSGATVGNPIREQSDTGLIYNSGFDMNLWQRYSYGYYLADAGWTAELTEEYQGYSMTLAHRDTVFGGRSRYGVHAWHRLDVSNVSGYTWNGPAVIVTQYVDFTYENHTSAPGYQDLIDAAAQLPGAGGLFPPTINISGGSRGTGAFISHSATGWRYAGWTMAIPTGDAEAVYLSEREYLDEMTDWSHRVETYYGWVTQHTYRAYSSDHGVDQPIGAITPWRQVSEKVQGWQPSGMPDPTVVLDAEPRDLDPDILTDVWTSQAEDAIGGAPLAEISYSALFNIMKTDPYYHAGISFSGSVDGRYVGTGPLKNPESVVGSRFVGWA